MESDGDIKLIVVADTLPPTGGDRMLADYKEQAGQYIRDHHTGTDGYIALCHKTEAERMPHKYYKLGKIDQAVAEYLGEDCYFSQNSFWLPRRLIENLRTFDAVYQDLDTYKLGVTAEWMYRKLQLEVFDEGKLPTPNRIVFSGRGLQLVWWLEPAPAKPLIGMWQVVEDYFFDVLKEYGADPKSKDAARVLRIPGSINSKNGVHAAAEHLHDYRYTLKELREYLPKKVQTTKFRAKKAPAKREVEVIKLQNLHTLYYARRNDLLKLCELRGWRLSEYSLREIVVFLYRYWGLCFCTDKQKALEDALELNQRFDIPLRENEVIIATQSAERAWEDSQDEAKNAEARKKGYPGAGYNYKNESLIKLLGITTEEQQHLETIIDKDVKNHRRQEARRAAGIRPREQYLAKADERRQEAIRMRKEGMSYRSIGQALGISQTQVKRIADSKN